MPEISTVLLSLASSIVGGVIVAATSHLLTRHREKERKLADIRVQYLIEAWKNIEKATNVGDASGRDKNTLYDGLEGAFASVILLGDREEIKAAGELVQQIKAGAGAPSGDQLLSALRRSLRRELGIEDDIQGHVFLRMHRD